jgi:hypothetical protein
MSNLLYRYHRFADRLAFLSACGTVTSIDPEAPVRRLGESDLMDIGTLYEPQTIPDGFDPETDTLPAPVVRPGYHINAAWRGGVPAGFVASVIPRPEGAPIYAGQDEAEAQASDPDTPPLPPVPSRVSIAQASILLSTLPAPDGKTALQALEDWIATQDAATQTLWHRGYELNRYSQKVALIGAMMEIDLDWFFRTADLITG